MTKSSDVLVMGAGPAALSILAELVEQGLKVTALASHSPEKPWPNTYGIWAEELESLGMDSLLRYRWSNTVSYFGDGFNEESNEITHHDFDYGLFDQDALKKFLLKRCGELVWQIETAEKIQFIGNQTEVICNSGNTYRARVVIDASGHKSKFISRPNKGDVAQQAAYGIVGKFSSPPVDKNQFVLMDYRPDHLNNTELKEPPSFLYAMDFGEDVFFVEETSLACFPHISFEVLKKRLFNRLKHRGIEIKEVLHEEHCLFPMNLALPDLSQPLLAFGGSASMVHPASGYLVGALLRRAPSLAKHLANDLSKNPLLDSSTISKRAWNVLWNFELKQKHRIYQFGLKRLMSFDEADLRSFFDAFFKLPKEEWYGFLTNTLSLPRLLKVMLRLFSISSLQVKLGMIVGGMFN